jgi:hypothetical protein
MLRLAKLFKIVRELFKLFYGTADSGYIPNSSMPHPALPTTPVIHEPGAAVTQSDKVLIKRTLYEMTVTDNSALQAKNRVLTEAQVLKLAQVDQLLCQIEAILGYPVTVNSGYRCPELNGSIPGAAVKSQHMLCEAVDADRAGVPATAATVEEMFQKVWAAAKEKKIAFGQLIVETAKRPYGQVYWLHVSLGHPYRDPAKCGQVLRMVQGPTGAFVYTMVGQV